MKANSILGTCITQQRWVIQFTSTLMKWACNLTDHTGLRCALDSARVSTGLGNALGCRPKHASNWSKSLPRSKPKFAFWILVWKPVPRQVAAGKGHHGLQC